MQLRNAISKLYLAGSDVELAERLGFSTVDDLAEAIGSGQIAPSRIAEVASPRDEQPIHAQPDFRQSLNGAKAVDYGLVALGVP